MANKFNYDEVRLQIEALVREHPELLEDEELLLGMLEGETELHGALSSLAFHASETKAMIEALGSRLEQLKDRKSRFETRVEALRQLMLKLMQAASLKKIELADATLAQVNHPPQIIGDLDPDKLPDDLVRLKREPNRTAIRAALESHRVIPGVVLSNAPPSLMIKVR